MNVNEKETKWKRKKVNRIYIENEEKWTSEKVGETDEPKRKEKMNLTTGLDLDK